MSEQFVFVSAEDNMTMDDSVRALSTDDSANESSDEVSTEEMPAEFGGNPNPPDASSQIPKQPENQAVEKQAKTNSSTEVFYCEVLFLHNKQDLERKICFVNAPNEEHTVDFLMRTAAAEFGIELANFECQIVQHYHLGRKEYLLLMPKWTDIVITETRYMFRLNPLDKEQTNKEQTTNGNRIENEQTTGEIHQNENAIPKTSHGAGINGNANLQQPQHVDNTKFYNLLLFWFFAFLAIFFAFSYSTNHRFKLLRRKTDEKLNAIDMKYSETISNLQQEIWEMQTRLGKTEEMVKHLLEHQNVEIMLVDNSNNFWNASTNPDLTIKDHTVTNKNDKWQSIRPSQGFSTNFTANGQLRVDVNYAEFTIGAIEGTIYLYLASKDFTKVQDGCTAGHVSGSYFFGISDLGYPCKLEANGTLNVSDPSEEFAAGFDTGDTIGIGLLVVQQSATAEAANCARCRQPNLWLFYTKNGEIWGNPKPLPANVPSLLFPTIVFLQPGSVTANFRQEPFVYEIPPAKGLCVGDHCQKPIF